MQPPNISLAPGSTNTAAVKQLQDWLVSVGYMTQAEVNTGYGIYGPRTTAAVQKLQQTLGVDNSTGPGYWGPRTMQAVLPNLPKPVSTSPTATTGNSTTPAVSPSYAMTLAAIDQIQQKATLGAPVRDFSQALDEAAKDPRIVAKYGDMAKLDAQTFAQNLDQLKTQFSLTAENQKTQFENDRKALAENMAAAGTAYSGFRGKAQKQLAQNEAGIVTSTRAQIKDNLNRLTSAFEEKYGTGATPNASINYENPLYGDTTISGLRTSPSVGGDTFAGEKAGGITGAVPLAKNADIAAAAGVRYGQDNPVPM